MDGNLIEAKVRGQRSIALSSGESEYLAMVSGSSEGMFLRHIWEFLRGDVPDSSVLEGCVTLLSTAQISVPRSPRPAVKVSCT